MSEQQLSLSVDCDRKLAAVQVSSQRTVEWTIRAPRVESRQSRPTLNLALVLDRSGSMRGEKLRHVQRAACHVVDLLDERDRVAVVTYDEQVHTLHAGATVTDKTRSELKGLIDGLRSGGQTDLAGGWLRGCQEVGEREDWNGVNRVLLLTDGLANRGITDEEELAHHARELRRRGVATSTFGVGLDFNEHLLEALAEEGGGHFFFIEQPGQIPDVFRQELGELLTVVAREAFLNVSVPRGIDVQVLGNIPHEREQDRLRIFLGDVSAGEERAIYTRVLLPPDAAGTAVVLRAELHYAGEDGRSITTAVDQWFSYAREIEVLRVPVRDDLLRRSSAVEMAAATARALKLERRGDRVQAQTLLVHALAANRPYLDQPESDSYTGIAGRIAQGLGDDERKQHHFIAYRRRHGRD